MKKSDLPWILPLLASWTQGKTLQVKCAVSGKWFDYCESDPIKFIGAEGDYRIKPELKAPGKVAQDASGLYGEGFWEICANADDKQRWNNTAIAVIRAYKAGELDLPDYLK